MDKELLIKSIDDAIDDFIMENNRYQSISDSMPIERVYFHISLFCQLIENYDKNNGLFINSAKIIQNRTLQDPNSYEGNAWEAVQKIMGILQGLKRAIEKDHLISIQQLINGELFSDYIDMADELLEKRFKDPAAVLIGTTLEIHLKKMAIQNSIPITVTTQNGDSIPKKTEFVNQDLSKGNIYSTTEQKQVTAWLGLRNDAAHGEYDKYTIEEVRIFSAGVRSFLIRHPV